MKHPCAYTGEMGEDFIDCACGDNEEYGFMLAGRRVRVGTWGVLRGEIGRGDSRRVRMFNVRERKECGEFSEAAAGGFRRRRRQREKKNKEDDPEREEENEVLVEDMIKKVKSSKTTIGDYNHTSQKRSALTLRQNLRSIQTHKVATRSAPRGGVCAACADANTRMKSNRW